MNAVSADQMMASYALTPDSAKSKALESWHPAAGTVTDMAGDDTVQTDTAVRTNTMVGAGHGRRSRHDTSAGCRANPMHQRQVGVRSSLWSGRREGASKTLIMCRTTEAGHWGIQQIRTFTTMQVIIDKSPSADRYRTLYVRDKSVGLWSCLILVNMHPSWPSLLRAPTRSGTSRRSPSALLHCCWPRLFRPVFADGPPAVSMNQRCENGAYEAGHGDG